MKKLLTAICYFLIVVGIAGFLTPLITMNANLPPSFEWPVGFADNIISTQSGLHIVPQFRPEEFRYTIKIGDLFEDGMSMPQVVILN